MSIATAMQAVGETIRERDGAILLALNEVMETRLAKIQPVQKIIIDMMPVAKAIDRLAESLDKRDDQLLLIDTVSRLVGAVEQQNVLLQKLSDKKPESTPKKKEFTISKDGDNYSGTMIVRE